MKYTLVLILCCLGLPALHASEPATQKKKSSSAKKSKQRPPFRWVNPLPKTHADGLLHATFPSKIAGTDVGYAILLPEDYETSSKRYPVVYYLHGGRPGNENKGIRIADFIVKYQKQNNVPPMIYVFNNGGPVSHYNVPDQVGIPGKPDALGADIFIKELIPFIDRTYRTIANREARGLEGFSQGGRGTMRLSLRYPELFSSVTAGGGGYETERRISVSPDSAESETLKFAKGDNAYDLARAYAANSDAPQIELMIYVGDKGFNYQNNLAYSKFLDSLGVKHRLVVVPGAEHSGKQVYEGKGLEIAQFHAKNLAGETDAKEEH
ncbi:MAG: alpha/beta hydrolase-fold protein [Planctomycetota bacterium]